MANNIIKRIWNQNTLVNIEVLKGAFFQDEDGGHTFEISGVDNSGNAISLSGTVAGVFLRPDNTDVPITGSASGGIVSVTLPAECYDVSGRFGLTVFVTADSKKTCVYAAIGTVGRTSSGSVAPGTSADVVDLINQISAAVATIPASWSGLMADIAPTYSTSAAYPVGAYVYYNGDLYRCTTAITTGETWTAAHWTTAVLGNDVSDLKTAFNVVNNAVTSKYSESYYGTTANNYYRLFNTSMKTTGVYMIKITAATAGNHTFQLGIAGSSGSMRDTLGTFSMSANETITIYNYVPSGANYTYARNTVGDDWNIVAYENINDLADYVLESKKTTDTLTGNYLLTDGATMFANKTIGNSGFVTDETGTMAWMPRILYPAGTSIKLTDYTHQRYFVKYWTGSIASANVHDTGWMTEDYTLPSDSYVGVSIKNKANDTSPFTFADAYRMLMVIPPNQWQKGLSERIEINRYAIADNNEFINSIDEAVTHKMSYVKGINHRGFNTEAPENTLPAFVLSRKKGFLYVETDIRYTSDGVAVLLHDETINRTARNADGTELTETVYISDITLAQAREYVFCKDMYSEYPTVQIPTFEEFITLCRNIGLHPYVEIKGSTYDASVLVDIVKGCGMLRNITWISFGEGYLAQVKTADPKARLGLLVTDVTSTNIDYAQGLKTDDNEVFIDAGNDHQSDNVALCKAAGIPLEVYTLNSEASITSANAYISGVSSDTLAANNVLYKYGIGN